MVNIDEFFLEDRAARFEPTVDLRQDLAERETSSRFERLVKMLMRMPRRFAPAAVLLVRAILRAIALVGLPLATVVRRLDL